MDKRRPLIQKKRSLFPGYEVTLKEILRNGMLHESLVVTTGNIRERVI